MFYSKNEIQRAERLRRLHESLGHPHDQALEAMIESNPTEFAPHEVRRASEILGPCDGCVQGKLIKKKGKGSSNPPAHQPAARLHMDIMFFLGIILLFCVDNATDHWSAVHLKSKESGTVRAGIEQIINFYAERGHLTEVIRTDRDPSFISAAKTLNDLFISFELTGSGAHERTVERSTRTFKGSLRSIIASLPYPLPKCLLPYAIDETIRAHNLVPNTKTAPRYPTEIIEKKKIDFDIYGKYVFGDIVQVRAPSDKFKTERGIVIGKNLNTKRSLTIKLLEGSGAVVNREPGQRVAITTATQRMLNDLCHHNGVVTTQDFDRATSPDAFHDDYSDDTTDNNAIQHQDDIEHYLVSRPTEEYTDSQTHDDEPIEPDDQAVEVQPQMDTPNHEQPITKGYTYDTDIVQETMERAATYWQPQHTSRRRTANIAKLNPDQQSAIIKEFEQLYKEKEVLFPVLAVPSNAKHPKVLSNIMDVKAKYDIISGLLLKYKGRFCLRGDQAKREWYALGQTISYMVRFITFLLLLNIIAFFGYSYAVTDIAGAYLNSALEHFYYTRISKAIVDLLVSAYPELETYRQPDGSILFEVRKALYGLPDSGARWAHTLKTTIMKLGFEPCLNDQNLYRSIDRTHSSTYILVHVDDLFITSSDNAMIAHVVNSLSQSFGEMPIETGNEVGYLGMVITKEQKGLSLSMNTYITNIISKFDCTTTSQYPHSMDILKPDTSDTAEQVNPSDYLSLLMSLMWPATHMRGDILYACTVKSSCARSPTRKDWNDVQKILAYLNATKHYKMYINPSHLQLAMSTDASFRSHHDLKSHSGYIIQLGDSGYVTLKSSKQKLLAGSSTHAELICATNSIDDLEYTRNIMEFFDIQQDPTPTQQDNRAAIIVSLTGDSKSGKLKHILAKLYRLREAVDTKMITIKWTPSDDMKADCLTKPIQGYRFHSFVKNILNLPDHI